MRRGPILYEFLPILLPNRTYIYIYWYDTVDQSNGFLQDVGIQLIA
jgi:hypothetical protein